MLLKDIAFQIATNMDLSASKLEEMLQGLAQEERQALESLLSTPQLLRKLTASAEEPPIVETWLTPPFQNA